MSKDHLGDDVYIETDCNTKIITLSTQGTSRRLPSKIVLKPETILNFCNHLDKILKERHG
tara:strand:+ start:68 stop:247 length:180 start_codon:yes stop_codon:yes gene_type:complete